MTIAHYLPQWLRNRLQKSAPPIPTAASKKERQILPTLRSVKGPPISLSKSRTPGHQLRGLT
jgi:hypothetical protein